jgi:flagellar biosynthesis protein FlhF
VNIKKIHARTSREAMRKLREELGEDAVILASNSVPGGVELIALPAGDIAMLAQPVVEARAEPVPPPAPVPAPQPPVAVTPAIAAAAAMPPSGPELPPMPAFDLAPAARDMAWMEQIMGEMRAMHENLRIQMQEMSWSEMGRREPVKAWLTRELLSVGFSAGLARNIASRLPEETSAREQATGWAKAMLARNLHTVDNEADLLDQRGVFALMGPTGAGKTTTTAKLAARFVVRHGAEKLALLTTDGYRIGGHEQLRIYGKILGVAVHSVRDAADLKLALAELRGKQAVLIDTVGMSQRDQAVAEQIAMLDQAGKPIKKLLMLNATSHGDTLNEVVQAYTGQGLSGCIISKTDEAASLGAVLDCAIRNKLLVHYVATGQRVPEDLHLGNRQYLVHRAFKYRPGQSPYYVSDDDLPLVMTAGHASAACQAESAVAHG